MDIYAITTSVNYADYLVHCLHCIAGQVQGVCVVTAVNDASIAVAERYGATPLVFDGWHDRGAAFNKAGAVRFAQEKIHTAYPDAWYLLIDADTMLPLNARETLDKQTLDPDTLYGATRVDFHKPESLKSSEPDATYGEMFAGYFQLYRRHVLYPEWSRSAEACDHDFAKQFTSCVNLPMTVGHCGVPGVNWEGRRSPLWKC
jgi:GT2 family glycosyltransferase